MVGIEVIEETFVLYENPNGTKRVYRTDDLKNEVGVIRRSQDDPRVLVVVCEGGKYLVNDETDLSTAQGLSEAFDRAKKNSPNYL